MARIEKQKIHLFENRSKELHVIIEDALKDTMTDEEREATVRRQEQAKLEKAMADLEERERKRLEKISKEHQLELAKTEAKAL